MRSKTVSLNRLFLLAMLSTALLLTGCGGGDPQPPTATVSGTIPLGLTVEIDAPIRDGDTDLPFSVTLNGTYDVPVRIKRTSTGSPESLPWPHKLKFKIDNGGDAANGTAIIVGNDSLSADGTIQIKGTGMNEPGNGQKIHLVAQYDGEGPEVKTPGFGVCPHPTSFAQYGAGVDNGDASLYFEYDWTTDEPGSTTKANLNQVAISELVKYGTRTDPPFIQGYIITWGEITATAIRASDTHTSKPVSSGPAATLSATQHYRFKCHRCNNGVSAIYEVDWGKILLGPITITRKVHNNNPDGKWRLDLTKSGVTSTRILP